MKKLLCHSALPVVVVTALIGVSVALAAVAHVSATGVGQVKLGDTPSELRDAGLAGRVRQGCEFAGPDARAAFLKPPLDGFVNFTVSTPRVVEDIQIRGGARASGVGIGALKSKVRDVFPNVHFDHSTESVFGITLAKVPVSDGGKFQFAIDTSTRRVVVIGVPWIAFCE